MTTATTTRAEARQAAIDAIPLLSRTARRILEALMAEVAYFEDASDRTPMSDMPRAHDRIQMALQAFELAVRAAGGHYDEG